jgi:hypothetical protein
LKKDGSWHLDNVVYMRPGSKCGSWRVRMRRGTYFERHV